MCNYKSASKISSTALGLEKEEKWDCPYESIKENKCIFHLTHEEKDHEKAEKKAKELIAKDTDDPFIMIGGSFRELQLSEINRELFLAESSFHSLTIEEGMTVEYGIDASHTEYKSSVEANKVEFKGIVNFGGATLHNIGKLSFRNSTFYKPAYMKYVDCGRFQISGATFHDKAQFGHSTYRLDSRVKRTTFHDDANFRHTKHKGKTEFHDTTFNGWARFRHVRSEDGLLSFEGAEFNTDTIYFQECRLEDSLYMSGIDLEGADFSRSDVRRCDFTNTSLKSSNLKQTDFTNSVLNGVDLRGSEIKEFKLAGAKLDEDTAFLGDPDDLNPAGRDHSLLSLIKPKPCVYDPRADFNEQAREDMTEEDQCNEAKSIYHTIEQAARQSSRPQLLSEAFVYRQDIQKRQYWSDMKNTVENIERDTSERLIAAGRWARAKTARVTLLYGESPWRIVGWSGLIISLFALLFTFGGYIRSSDLGVMELSLSQAIQQPAMFGDTLAHSIYYSMMTYISFGPLGYEPVGMGKLLVTVESALGAVMIALLVFVFGRRAAR